MKNFIKISLIIKEYPEEILIKLAIVLKFSKSSWSHGIVFNNIILMNHCYCLLGTLDFLDLLYVGTMFANPISRLNGDLSSFDNDKGLQIYKYE